MEKKNLKTLALLGLAGGLLLSSQAADANEVSAQDYSNYLAAKGCATCGAHKQGSKGKNTKDSEIADNYQPGASHGCGGSSGQYYQSGDQYYQQSGASHGCGGQWREISADQYNSQQGSQGQYQQGQQYQNQPNQQQYYQNQQGQTQYQPTSRSYNK